MNTIDKIILHYGKQAQCCVAMEECAELIQAINKCLRYPGKEKCKNNLIEEIADVSICIEQLKFMFGISDGEIDLLKRAKLDRMDQIIEEIYWSK